MKSSREKSLRIKIVTIEKPPVKYQLIKANKNELMHSVFYAWIAFIDVSFFLNKKIVSIFPASLFLPFMYIALRHNQRAADFLE